MRMPANQRAARSPLRQKAAGGAATYSSASIQPPVGGWDAVHPLAAMPEDRAIVLDNWFPEPGYLRVRRGSQVHSVGLGTGPVESLLVYNGTTVLSNKMFGVANNSIYDVTSAVSVGAAAVTGLTNNRFQYVNFTTSGGHFLWCCNGVDSPQVYDGSTWSNPTITGITAADAINVNVHKNRLWMILQGSMNAAYLATSSYQGAASTFPLGAVMAKGGYLVAMGTWTHDGGAGSDDYAVFVSSRGQAAVYKGTDPSSSSTWSLIGVYDLGAPIGYRCLTKVAGDLALISIDGVLPFSLARGTDRGADATIAITANINNAMNTAARLYGSNFGWELIGYPKGTAAILNVPVAEGVTQQQFVMNTLTGAWCRFTGMNANCWALYNDNLYFGGNAGYVFLADTGAVDLITPVDAVGQGAYNFFKSPGVLKQFKMIQPVLTTDSSTRPSVGISTDFKDNAVLGTPTSAAQTSAVYNTAVYDTDIYPVESRSVADWTSITGIGLAGSIHFRAKTGHESGTSMWGISNWGTDYWSYTVGGEVIMRLNSFNVLFERGGLF